MCHLCLCTSSFWDQTWKSSPIWNVILSWLRKKHGGIMRWLIHFCSEVDQAISTHILLTKTKSSLTTLGREVLGTDQIGRAWLAYWLCWVFMAAQGLSSVGATLWLWFTSLALWWFLFSWSTGSLFVAPRLSCSMACGIFPDQGWNLCPLHWQADSQLLEHQWSPWGWVLAKEGQRILITTVYSKD